MQLSLEFLPRLYRGCFWEEVARLFNGPKASYSKNITILFHAFLILLAITLQPQYEKVARLFNGPNAIHAGIILMTRVELNVDDLVEEDEIQGEKEIIEEMEDIQGVGVDNTKKKEVSP